MSSSSGQRDYILSNRLSSTASHAGDGIAYSTTGSSNHPTSGLCDPSGCIADSRGDEGERVLIIFRHLDLVSLELSIPLVIILGLNGLGDDIDNGC